MCNDKLSINLTREDIGRSHVIGKVINGNSQVIVRFISYRNREKVYNAKKKLIGDPDKIFITENLTQFRAELVKKCLEAKQAKQIYTFWTS